MVIFGKQDKEPMYFTTFQYSMMDAFKNCAKYGKGFKIGTNEAYNIKIKTSVGDILTILCFSLCINVAASDEGISLKRKILEKVFTQLQELSAKSGKRSQN